MTVRTIKHKEEVSWVFLTCVFLRQLRKNLLRVCYNKSMDVYTITDSVRVLRQRLEPATRVAEQLSAVERQYPSARKSAVLLPLFEQDGAASIAFIRRASTLRLHSGEIALPGGSSDPADPSPVATALREAQEEIGLEPERVEVLGVLPPIFTVVSNYVIVPVVAFLPQGLGTLHLQTSEVAELLIVSLQRLADPRIARVERWTRSGKERNVYFYDYDPFCIWGATGHIVYEFLETLRADPACNGE